MTLRPDLAIIKEWVTPGSRVLDLGCGDGALLQVLRDEHQVEGYGLEINTENIVSCLRSSLNVIQLDLDAGLDDFDDQAFDYVIMTQTLQAVHFPDHLLQEMLRVGKQGIVTFPNFAYWKNRIQLGLQGNMPVSRALPAQWYDTHNIHLCTIKDFRQLCHKRNISIQKQVVLDHAHRSSPPITFLPNLLGQIAIYRCQRNTS
ncbi:Methionine biosynthesis protein MetW [hydrothermal vent metagenome]|uniref:Methionine biosynthesis protein MetW n=1 Tax=hydrothermal vent metagenome TaxID=652676 RepID=A0A3B1B379_9ZZZZ